MGYDRFAPPLEGNALREPKLAAVRDEWLGCRVKTFKYKLTAKHLKLIARTVMVQEGNVEGAYRTLNRILTTDGLVEDIKRRRYYEKPCRRRQRESYDTCRRIYNMEMTRKINFLMRKNRADPWQGC
nr:28S ribosomal protein S21, mitochondrial-like [Jaculus jaculus]